MTAWIQYTLVTDGRSDRVLQFPIDWLLGRLTSVGFSGEWADPSTYGVLGRGAGLRARLDAALENYPCNLLFVHRDAESVRMDERVAEIEETILELYSAPPAVCVVPVRMTETWLMIEESALRMAAGNPNGRVSLSFPQPRDLEKIANPKEVLFDLLRAASQLKGRRLRKFRGHQARLRVAELIDDFSALDSLPAFRAFQARLVSVLKARRWR